MSLSRRSLRYGAARTAGAILLLAAAVALLITITTYQTSYDRTMRSRSAQIVRDYTEKFKNIGHGWEEHLMREKTRLEFSRLLDSPADRWDRLRAYLAALTDSPQFAGLTLCNAAGAVLFQQGPATNCLGPARQTASGHAQHYVLDAVGNLFIELDAPIWLGPDGMGAMHLSMPLDHAFLWRNAFPDTELFIEWQGRILASSAGETGLVRGRPAYTGRIDRAGQRYEQRGIALPGNLDPPQLLIQAHIVPPFSVAESIWMGIVVFVFIAVLMALVLYGWLARLLPRIESLSQATRLYAADGKSSATLDRLLQRAIGREIDELSEVALSTINMVAAVSLREQLRQGAETRLRASEQRFREVAECAGEFIWEIDAQHTYAYLSEGAGTAFGRPVGELVGQDVYAFVPAGERETSAQRARAHARTGAPFNRFLLPITRPGGELRYLALSGTAVLDAKGRLSGSYRGIAEDVTERRRNEESLLLAEKVFENSAQAILITDAASRIISVNPAFTEITGYHADEAIGENPRKFASGRHDAAFYAAMWGALKRYGIWAGEVWDRRKNGAVYPKWLTINAVHDVGSGAVSHYVAIFSDITEQKENEARIAHLAYHDPLTGLPNRYALNAHLAQSLADARRNDTELALMFIDLDRFKNINDSLGHDVGDQLLIAVAKRIRAALRESDTVARLGGDEFVIVVPGLAGPEDAARVAEKIIAEVGAPLVLAGHSLHTSPSIGIGIFPTDGNSADSLMKNADAAMYYAKQHGRNTYHFFTADMNATANERLLLESQLHHALARHEFFLAFQPQFEIRSGRVVGVEALVRWRHPDRGEVQPEAFIAIAEEIGLIIPLGAWVLEEACRQAMSWSAGASSLRIAVNISVHQLADRQLAEHVAATLARTGLPAERLELEITESAVMAHPEAAVEMLRSLAALGVRLAIDDFGTGYSSLAYLKRLPNSRLKIDRSFVMDLETNGNDVAITEGIIALARSLGLAVTAEGIETPIQLDMLRNFGCAEGQGFLFSRPLSPEALREFMGTAGMQLHGDGAVSLAVPPQRLH